MALNQSVASNSEYLSSPEDYGLSSLRPWICQEPVVSRRSPGETVGTCRGTRRLCLHGDLFLLLCVGVELDFQLANVLTGLVNVKKQTKNARQLLKIFYIPDFSKL